MNKNYGKIRKYIKYVYLVFNIEWGGREFVKFRMIIRIMVIIRIIKRKMMMWLDLRMIMDRK